MTARTLTEKVKADALRIGFSHIGICTAGPVSVSEKEYLERWTAEGNHAGMEWMLKNSELRDDPRLLVPGCRSIICVAWRIPEADAPAGMHVARFARFPDYHRTVKDMLFTLLKEMNAVAGVKGRAFTDSAPVLERYWAVQAGIGFIGLNHCLIIPGEGSHFILGELIVDTDLEADAPLAQKQCSGCGACVKACPTGALHFEDGRTVIDARRCLSYHTIENPGQVPEELVPALRSTRCILGCDRCQNACPENSVKLLQQCAVKPTDYAAFTDTDWENLTEERFAEVAAGTALERPGYTKLRATIDAVR